MDRFEWLSLWLFLAVFWIVDFLFYTYWGTSRRYNSLKTFLIPKPPGWIFPLVWNVLYPLTAVSIWLYLNWTTDDRTIYDAVLALALANYALNKAWYPLFFGFGWLWLAFLDAVLLWSTATAVLVLLWVDTQNNGDTSYVAAGLYIPYFLWLTFATFLNLDLAWNNSTVVISYQERDIHQRKKKTYNNNNNNMMMMNNTNQMQSAPPSRGIITTVNRPTMRNMGQKPV